jgi:4-diphosphocytidyl-2-C-methyl-D-erythritol kinase
MQAISLHDDVTVEVVACARGPAIEVRAGFAPDARLAGDAFSRKLPQGRDNIAYEAAGLALRLWGGGSDGVQVTVAKRIPVAAGLAGGSADAAAVLLSLARLLAPDVGLPEIIRAGAGIGADVPFCVAAIARADSGAGFADDAAARTSALCEGVGDELSSESPEKGRVVLVRPAACVRTPQIYADWDAETEKWDGRGFPPDGKSNDLTAVAIHRYPVIGRILREMKKSARADRVFMTGSGPTLVALYADGESASRGFADLSAAYKDRADVGAVLLCDLI